MPIRPIAASFLSAVVLVSAAGLPASVAFAQTTPKAAADRANQVTGIIDAVTVYRGQALVTRVLDVAGGTGLREMIVTDLPEAILPGSLYAESADGIEVRSVSYRVRPVVEDARESVRTAEKAVRDASDAVEAAKSRQAYLEWQRQYLDKLEGFVAPDRADGAEERRSERRHADQADRPRHLSTQGPGRRGPEARDRAGTLNETLSLKQRELGVLTASTSPRPARRSCSSTPPGPGPRCGCPTSSAAQTRAPFVQPADRRHQS